MPSAVTWYYMNNKSVDCSKKITWETVYIKRTIYFLHTKQRILSLFFLCSYHQFMTNVFTKVRNQREREKKSRENVDTTNIISENLRRTKDDTKM